MEQTVRGGANLGLVVIVKCPICGDAEPVPHKEFTSIKCDRKPCVGSVTMTNGQGPGAKKSVPKG